MSKTGGFLSTLSPSAPQAARAREVQAAQMEQLQRDMAAAMLAAKEHSSAAGSLGLHKVGAAAWVAGLQPGRERKPEVVDVRCKARVEQARSEATAGPRCPVCQS